MNFLQPQYLWAFTGLLVPIAIHLLSRKEGRVIRIGSIRHIRETPTRQFRSVRLNEYLLLFLRCLLLSGMVFFMSGWYLEGMKATRQWLVIEPGLEDRPGLRQFIDSLTNAGYERRFLTRDFPRELVSVDVAETPDYYSRLEDLRGQQVDAVVLATNRATGFTGPRTTLPENVKWIEIAPEPSEEAIQLVQLRRDSVWERRGTFSATSSQFKTYRKASAGNESQPPDTVRIIIAYDQEFETDKEIIMASLDAIKPQVPEIIKMQSVMVAKYSNSTPDWLIWLSASEPLAGAKSNVNYSEKSLAGILEPAGEGNYLLTTRLNSEVAVNRNLAVHLMKALFPNGEASALAKHHDRRVVSAKAAFGGPSSSSSGTVGQETDQPSMKYLAIALLVILALERSVAYQRNQ